MLADSLVSLGWLVLKPIVNRSPGWAQPRVLASGDRTPHPNTAPKSICMHVDGPIMIQTGSKAWIVWISLAIMLADSLVSLGWLVLKPIVNR
jgi:hypothetical protein